MSAIMRIWSNSADIAPELSSPSRPLCPQIRYQLFVIRYREPRFIFCLLASDLRPLTFILFRLSSTSLVIRHLLWQYKDHFASGMPRLAEFVCLLGFL